MTVERRYIVGLNDLRALVFECTSCGTHLSLPPDKVKAKPPERCFGCGEPWWKDGPQLPEGVAAHSIGRFLGAIPDVRVLQNQAGMGFRLLFEFDDPTAVPPRSTSQLRP